jgi:probable rRNA maturation factor
VKKAASKRSRAATAPAHVANLVRVSVERGAAAAGVTSATLKKRAERMLAALDLTGVEVSLALVGDATIRDLNRQWRKKDHATDVLSFPMMDDARPSAPPSTGLTLIGDVVVSTPTAARQAKARKATVTDEITVLLAHGVLHLLGFDHGTDDEEREMDAYAGVLVAAAASRLPMRLKLVPVRPR